MDQNISEEIRQIVEGDEPLTVKTLRITKLNGWVNYEYLKGLFPDTLENTK